MYSTATYRSIDFRLKWLNYSTRFETSGSAKIGSSSTKGQHHRGLAAAATLCCCARADLIASTLTLLSGLRPLLAGGTEMACLAATCHSAHAAIEQPYSDHCILLHSAVPFATWEACLFGHSPYSLTLHVCACAYMHVCVYARICACVSAWVFTYVCQRL